MKETRYPADIIYSVGLKSGQTVENQFISCYGHSDDVIDIVTDKGEYRGFHVDHFAGIIPTNEERMEVRKKELADVI